MFRSRLSQVQAKDKDPHLRGSSEIHQNDKKNGRKKNKSKESKLRIQSTEKKNKSHQKSPSKTVT